MARTKSERDQAFDRINASLDRTEALVQGLLKMIEEAKGPPRPQLTLVPSDEEGDDG